MLDGGSQPPLNLQLHPGEVRVVGHGPLDQVTRHGIKEGFDVQIDDPIGPPAALPCRPDRIQRGSAGVLAIGGGVGVWFPPGSRTIVATVCATRSARVGMPRGRVPPVAFGISTSRTGGGWYDPDAIRFQTL